MPPSRFSGPSSFRLIGRAPLRATGVQPPKASNIIAILVGLLLSARRDGIGGIELTDSKAIPCGSGGSIEVHSLLVGAEPGQKRLSGLSRLMLRHPGGANSLSLSFAVKGRRVVRLGELLPALPPNGLRLRGTVWPGPPGDVSQAPNLGTIAMGEGSVRPIAGGLTTETRSSAVALLVPAVQMARPMPHQSVNGVTTLKSVLNRAARIPVNTPDWTDHEDADPGVTTTQLFAFVVESLGGGPSLSPAPYSPVFTRKSAFLSSFRHKP